MRLRGIDFRPVCNAAGAQGFFGEGYPYHRFWKFFGMTFEGCGFVAKTTTLNERAGNMPLRADLSPREVMPECIAVKMRKGVALNAVGLSGPGALALLDDGRWQRRSGDAFYLSFMSAEKDTNDRLRELREFVALLKQRLCQFSAPFGLEINFSCPNVGLDPGVLIEEVGKALDIAAVLNIPLQAKFNAVTDVDAVCTACRHEACDAVTMSNTIPWGKLPERIDWAGLFGSDTSPLARFDGGGLSGWPLAPIVCDWIRKARDLGFEKPIWACGGIDSVAAVGEAKAAGASGIQFGTVAIVRPWRTKGIIRHANEVFAP